MPVLKYFRQYLEKGYYPYFLENEQNYYSKLNNVIEKVIYEDLATCHNLRQSTLVVLKKILWLIATSDVLQPNIDKIAQQIGSPRETVYSCVDLLCRACLTQNLYPATTGMKLIRKPAKIYLEDTNLLAAFNGQLSLAKSKGSIRETFFANQVSYLHKTNTHPKVDFFIDEQYAIEVGGNNKDNSQLENIDAKTFIAADDIPMGFGDKIPLYLFGLLY